MAETTAKQKIRALQKKWIISLFLSDLLAAVGLSVFTGALLFAITGVPVWFPIIVFLALFAFLIFRRKAWAITETDIAKYLDEHYPALEESTALVLKPEDKMNRLERLQHVKVQEQLHAILPPRQAERKIALTSGLFLICLTAAYFVSRISAAYDHTVLQHPAPGRSSVQPAQEKLLPQITSVNVTIIPPAYTLKTTRRQDQFNLDAEEGSLIRWQIRTSVPVHDLFLIFNDSASLRVHPTDSSYTIWSTGREINASGFYQVKTGGELSEYYKLEMIKDQPPVIHIEKPAQYTTIGLTGSQTATLIAGISDDYGIHDASITATIANGSGEAVKFRDQKLYFTDFHPGYRSYQLQKLLSPASLGMQPGDELYYYIDAEDNHNQQSRSDVYILKLKDTAAASTVEGLSFGLTIKPEYFRSERQIILETEQLIKSKMHPADEPFKNKSNDLGIDQKLLRLRYGKFLGEEAESGIPGSEGDQALANPENFGNAQKVLDQYTDKHDNAEDASFFEPEIKKQLKATLTEMWRAELQLRVFKPQEALAHEYKALRLLKDLQQQSRAYVAKTSFATAPIKAEKRLTGNLDKIIQPQTRQDYTRENDPEARIPTAMGILAQLKMNEPLSNTDLFILEQAQQQLNKTAASAPSVYLAGAQAMRKTMDALHNKTKPATADIALAEFAFQKMVNEPGRSPAALQSPAGTELSQQYFKNAKRMRKKP